MTSVPGTMSGFARNELRTWFRSTNGVIAAAALLVLVGYTLWLASMEVTSPPSLPLNLISILFDVASVATVWRLLRHPALDARTRQAWRLCMFAFLALSGGDVAWSVFDNILGIQPVTSAADVLYFAYYPLFLSGILRFPMGDRSPSDSYKLALDIALVVIAGGAVLWYLILSPSVHTNYTLPIGGVVAVAYPLCDLVIIFATALAILMRPPRVSRTAVHILGVAALARFVSSLIYGYHMVQTTELQTGNWSEMGWAFGALLWLWAAQYQLWRAGQSAMHEQSDETFVVPSRSLLPYIALLVGYALLVVVARPYWSAPIGVVIGAALLLTVVVTIRQWMGVNENVKLLSDQSTREARFRSLVQNSSDVVTVIDADNTIRFVSPAIERVLGWKVDDAVGKSVFGIVHHDDIPAVQAFIDRIRHDPATPSASDIWRCRNSAGEWRSIETVATCLMDDPAVQGIVLNTRDVSERMTLQAELTRQAYHDPLTHLANRGWF
jgi:PAS domain S-box-containing protein